MEISVIIPVYNEEDCIEELISFLKKNRTAQVRDILVVDGKSTDNTVARALEAGAEVVVSPKKGRAAQMNFGAAHAQADILYFLHADTYPDPNYSRDIIKFVTEGYKAGCYMLSFDYQHWFLKFNCWFTRFDVDAFRFGDQSLFVTKEVFIRTGGFKEDLIVMEDQEIIQRLKKVGEFKIIRKKVITSARKYLENGIYKMQSIFFLIYFMYKLGFSQLTLLKTYKRLIKQNKL